MRKINPVIVISIILFIIPFFWFPPGTMDLGGDGNRLYFYEPQEFLKNISFYSIDAEGKGNVEQRHAYLVYVSFIAFIKYFIHSPYIIISLFNGVKFSVGFLSVYLIIKELLQRGKRKEENFFSVEISAMLSGIFYILITGYEKLIVLWARALHSHDQIFLNPLMFFLLLRYVLTKNSWYLWSILTISFIFSTSFSTISAPPFFAFYPIALLFIACYVSFIRKIKIPVKMILFGLVLFLGLQSFHLLPSIASLLSPDSVTNSIVFKESVTGGVNYFMAVHGLGKASISLFVPAPGAGFRWMVFIPPLVIILSYLLQRKKRMEIILVSIFFFITFFLVTANITDLGFELYRWLFYVPGFSMFRNFYVQWGYVFIFFYALLFGLCLSVIFERLKPKITLLSSSLIAFFLLVSFWPLINGQLIDRVQWGSNDVKIAMRMDPRYEETINFIRKLPTEGKMLLFPLTDNFNQVVYGLNNAAYVGPSSISILTSKKSFSGYQILYPNPIPEEILRYARDHNYEALSQIFSIFNIRYIFHNTDPKIYEEKFPQFPNSYMMTSLPKTQEEYKEFVQKFPVHLIYRNAPYEIYEVDSTVYRSEVYIPDTMYKEDMIAAIKNKKLSFQSVFIDSDTCQQNEEVLAFCAREYEQPQIQIETKRINPTRYMIHVQQSEASSPFLLVFQNSFHKDWKLSIDQNSVINERKHILVNKYANAWIISSDDRNGKSDYVLYLNLSTQRYFQYGLWITGMSVSILIIFILRSLLFRKYNEKN